MEGGAWPNELSEGAVLQVWPPGWEQLLPEVLQMFRVPALPPLECLPEVKVRIAQIPANLIAGFMGLQPHALFQVAEADWEDVKVSFT
jgi:hypothetical protein